jgi:hypothetical protein
MADQLSRQHDWVRNVIHGEKHREKYSTDAYWFSGDVFFKHEEAVMRLLPTTDGKWLVLRQNSHWGQVFDDNKVGFDGKPRSNMLPALTFHSIGVHHPYHGGKLEGVELHRFMHWQQVGRLESVIEAAKTTAIKTLDEYSGNALVGMAEKYEQDHFEYRSKLAPDLPDLPTYHVRIRKLIDDRLAKYRDPKAVEQRERNKARTIAKKALGL